MLNPGFLNSLDFIRFVATLLSLFSIQQKTLNLTGVKFCLFNSRVLIFQQQSFNSKRYNICKKRTMVLSCVFLYFSLER